MPTSSGYISPGEIIADVTTLADDEGFKEFSEGAYMSEVQQALTELAFDTYFDKKVLTLEILGRKIIPIPEGMFSEDRIYAFNGNNCDAGQSHTVWYARNYLSYGNSTFKQQKGQNNDHFMDNVASNSTIGSVLYYNKVDGEYHLSDAVARFENLLIQYRGIGCALGSAPIIPNELRQAVKDYVALEIATKLFAKYRTADRERVLRIYEERKNGGRQFGNVGSWVKAKRRVQAISNKERDDMRIYLSTLSTPKV